MSWTDTRTVRFSSKSRYVIPSRRLRLLLPLFVAAGVLFIPSLIVAPAHQPAALLPIQVISCGIMLGIGRQGIDMLMLRLFTASLAAPVGWKLATLWSGTTRGCGGPDCAGWLVIGSVILATLVAFLLALVAVPTALLWNRGFEGMEPELRWRAPRSRQEWLVVVLGSVLVAITLWALLGIPSPA